MRRAITTLLEERASLWEQMKGISDKAEAEGRDLSAEEFTEYQALETDFDAKDARAKRLQKEAGIESTVTRNVVVPEIEPGADEGTRTAGGIKAERVSSLMDRVNRSVKGEDAAGELREMAHTVGIESVRKLAEQGDQAARKLYTASDEYRDAYADYMRAGNMDYNGLPEEVRAALNVGTNANGGFTVPVEFLRQLIESERFYGVIRGLSTVLTTDGSGPLSIPKVDDSSRAASSWLAEAASFSESEDAFLQATLGAFKAGHVEKLSDEIIHDSAFDILGFVARSAGQSLGLLENTAYVTGASASTTTPEGLFTKATIGRTMPTGNSTSITSADELFELYHSVRPPYRPRASWIFSDTIIKQIRQLKATTTGQYLWQPSLTAGDPDTLVGRPVYADPDVAVPAANALVGGFGDVASAYFIRDVQDVTVKILNELYAGTGQVGYRIHKRTDGDLIDTVAFKTLKCSAT